MYSAQDLATLVAVADTGSVRAAADALGRTQPAVTQAIKRLEDAVGFALLDRTSYRARLTERGEIFVKRARVAVQQARGLTGFAAMLARGVEPRVRIVCHGAIPIASWMGLVREVEARFPETVLELETAEGDAPIRRLMEDDAQFAVLLHAIPDRYGASVEHKPLGAVEFVNVVRADRLSELEAGAALPQILVADFDNPATTYGVAEGQRQWRVSNHRIKAEAIEAGHGWGSVPRVLVEQALASGVLCAVSHGGLRERGGAAFGLYRKRAAFQGPAASFIWDAIEPSSGAAVGA